MAAEIQDVLIRLRTDSTGAEEGFKRANRSITELNQTVELAKNAFAGASIVVREFGQFIDRGQAVSEVSAAFRSLGGTSQELDKLRASTQGLVSDVDLMRASNQALLADLRPEQFEAVAAAADKLGDAIGVGTKDALDQLSLSLATGQERALKRYGIIVDSAKAEEVFAASLGKTADQLNEAGKKAAFQEAAVAAISEKITHLADGADTTGDALQRLGSIGSNTFDRFAQAVNENESLAGAIDSLARSIQSINVEQLAKAASLLAQIASIGINGIVSAGQGIGNAAFDLTDSIFHLTDQSKVDSLNAKIQAEQARIAKGGDKLAAFLGASPTAKQAEQIAAWTQQRDQIIQSNNALMAMGQTSDFILSKFENLSLSIGGKEGFVRKLDDFYINSGSKAKKAAEESTDAWKNSFQSLTNIFNDTLGNSAIFGENAGERDFLAERLEEQFRTATDFWADILTPMFEGQAANFEDIFTGAAKNIGIQVGTGLFSGLQQEFFPAFSEKLVEIAKAGGLDKWVANAVSSSGVLSLGGIAGVAAGGGLGFLQAGGLQSALHGGSLSFGEQAALALPTFGASFLFNPISSMFGGDSAKAKEREARESLIDQIFGGDFGGFNISGSNFNASGKFGGQGTALVNPLAQILSGGEDKLGSDLAGIFENAVTEGDNFNETIVSTLSLMDKLNMTADDAKSQLSELFLDGKISLDEFSVGIDNLNILAQEDLVGPNSVADAIAIVTENLDNPRVALKGLELAFKEMAELGIDSSEEIHSYLTEKFGPQIASAFDDIMSAGLDTWEEIGGAAPDQLKLIFNELKPLQVQFDDTAESARRLGEADMSSLNDGLKKTLSLARDARKEIDALQKAANGAASASQELNRRPA